MAAQETGSRTYGPSRGRAACAGGYDDRFWEMLLKSCTLLQEVGIPQFDGFADSLMVFGSDR